MPRAITPATLPPAMMRAVRLRAALDTLQRKNLPYAVFTQKLRRLIRERQTLNIPDKETANAIDALLLALSEQWHTATITRHHFLLAARASKAEIDDPSQWPRRLRAALEARIVEYIEDPLHADKEVAALLAALQMAQSCHSARDIAALTDGAVSHSFLPHHV